MPAATCQPLSTAPRKPFTHPLELYPMFRRWPRSLWRDLIYTFVWNMQFVVVFTALALLFDPRAPVRDVLRIDFILAQCIGYVIHLLFALGEWIAPGMDRKSIVVRLVYYAGVPIVGLLIGYWISAEILGWSDFLPSLFTARGIASLALVSMVISAILFAIILHRERATRAETTTALERARLAEAQREIVTGRLKLLEAQVEPHFLYNTLAHVVSLIDTEPGAARRMIEKLIELQRATAAAPGGDGTLGHQLQWLRAYLEILQLRMGGRLAWRIDVPPELLSLRVPPMLLQPVVENAVKHGLEPKIEGGRLDITARREADGVRLVVRDTGPGFRETAPQGNDSLGLANLRARLAAWYGHAARVVIEDNVPAGAAVSIVLPATAAP